MGKIIRVLIVDDSSLIRRLFADMLSSDPNIEVIGSAIDPIDAREKIKLLNPDVVTLDIEMPQMDGISFLEKIMTLRPTPVVMVSTLTQKGADATVRALSLGAVSYIGKPSADDAGALLTMKDELIEKVKAASITRVRPLKPQAPTGSSSVLPFTPSMYSKNRVIFIGSSTGGVEALGEILPKLPKTCPPVLIVQHMSERFTKSLATRLNSLCEIGVHEAKSNQRIESGNAYIAPGGSQHMRIVRQGNDLLCKLEMGAPVSGHQPSVDFLFFSAAEVIGAHAIGVILTGMGRDGANGLKKMHSTGAYTIGQNEASCVVYGMPKVAFQEGGVFTEVSLEAVAPAILKYCNQPVRLDG